MSKRQKKALARAKKQRNRRKPRTFGDAVRQEQVERAAGARQALAAKREDLNTRDKQVAVAIEQVKRILGIEDVELHAWKDGEPILAVRMNPSDKVQRLCRWTPIESSPGRGRAGGGVR